MTTQTDPAPELHPASDLHPAASTDLPALRRQLAVLHGGKVTSVHVPSESEGRFALLLALTHRGPNGGNALAYRWLTVGGPVWRLERTGPGEPAVAAASGDALPRLVADLRVLVGREITDVRITEPGWDTRIEFGDHRLSVFPTALRTPSTAPDWALRLPSRHHLVIGPGARWESRVG
ncbi:hypothetical protein HUT16_35075 [Kitasatospora sp. NA04385]|uniref:hypothetical protein n=1 Tax=Kitasatospora sp. NA04385 TaxID=2742135 RepID=UPI001590304E|nr:hypothetical protein [Kitasatospora sp. NA04385]QKW23628.1 hypothetical protein HUT16_35075 [Kitasatospora sp. NA04385]